MPRTLRLNDQNKHAWNRFRHMSAKKQIKYVLWPGTCDLAGKESTCNVGDLGSIAGLGRSPGEWKGYPLQCSCLENSMDCIVRGVAKSQTRLSDSLIHSLTPSKGFHLCLSLICCCLCTIFMVQQKAPSHGVTSEPQKIAGKMHSLRQILWDEDSLDGFDCIFQCSWIPSLVLNLLCFIPKSSAFSYRHWNSSVSLMASFKLVLFLWYFFYKLASTYKTIKAWKEIIWKEKHL